MKKENEGSFQTLDMDALDTVTGGIGVAETLANDPAASQTHSGSMSFKADRKGRVPGMPDVTGTEKFTVQNEEDSFMAMCPVCGMETPHKVFSGARAICGICGHQSFK